MDDAFQKSFTQPHFAQLAAVYLLAENAADLGLLKSAPLLFTVFIKSS
jgi:hypothetical protein